MTGVLSPENCGTEPQKLSSFAYLMANVISTFELIADFPVGSILLPRNMLEDTLSFMSPELDDDAVA